MHLELETRCIYYWHLLHIARESYHLRHLELNYYLPPAKFDFKPLLERFHKTQQQKSGGGEQEFCIRKRNPSKSSCTWKPWVALVLGQRGPPAEPAPCSRSENGLEKPMTASHASV